MFKVLTILLVSLVIHLCPAQEIVEEEITITNNNITLTGTLTYPKGATKTPLVIFVAGSGMVDRNGNVPGAGVYAYYIKQLADSLNKEGIAFFRYDKRTTNPENLKTFTSSTPFEILVDDVNTITTYLKKNYTFGNITLIGHSQGSLVAMLAAKKGNVAKFVSLAGLGEPMEKAIIRQMSEKDSVLGSITASHFKELNETGNIEEPHPSLLSIFAPQNMTFLKTWNSYNPSKEIATLKIPVLIIQGESDIQVTVDDAEALHKAAKGSTLKLIPNMAHTLKIVNSIQENYQSYTTSKFPLSTELVTTLTEFIKK